MDMTVNYYLPVGAILKVDLKLNADHSGIYLGYGNVAELDGSGKIMVSYLDDFLKGDRSWRCGENIYAAYDNNNLKFLADEKFALRAIKSLCQIREYAFDTENCHKFTTGCITGNFDNDVIFFSSLEEEIRKYFHISFSNLEWKKLGLSYLQPNLFKNLEDYEHRLKILGKKFDYGSKIINNFVYYNFVVYHDFINESYSHKELWGRMLTYLLECMQQGFALIENDIRHTVYSMLPGLFDYFIERKKEYPKLNFSLLQKFCLYTRQTSYDELIRIRDIEHLILLMARAEILNLKTESVFSNAKIKSIVNSFDTIKSMIKFKIFLEDELKCKELHPAAFYNSLDGTVSDLYDSMKEYLPAEIFNKIFTWNDPVLEEYTHLSDNQLRLMLELEQLEELTQQIISSEATSALNINS